MKFIRTKFDVKDIGDNKVILGINTSRKLNGLILS